jgi:hypothetical protein
MSAALNRKATMPPVATVRRIRRPGTLTPETGGVITMANEKYTKSQ